MLLFFLIPFLLLRLVFWVNTFPNPDEAYYWLWGQHPDWSYYDHPPLQAWIQGAFTALLGRSNFVLRLPNLISNGVFFYTYYRICRYLYGENALSYWWIVVLLVLASPLYFLFLALAWHDHWLITLVLVAMYLFIRFLDRYLADGRGETWRLYGAAVAIALAILCKYSVVFVGLGFAATLIADKRLRPLWRDHRIYLAGAIALLGFMPILIWNRSNDFQSFRYYVNRSVNTGAFSLKIGPFLGFVVFSWLMVSPLIWVYFWRIWKQRPFRSKAVSSNGTLPERSVYPTVALWIFTISTGTLTVVSLLSAALYYWNILAYLLLFPLAAATVKTQPSQDQRSPHFPAARYVPRPSSLFVATQLFGLLFAALLVVHYSVLPLSALGSKTEDPDSRMLFGWDGVATVVRAEEMQLKHNPFLITTDYRSASALAYVLNDKNAIAIADRVDQFDFWFGNGAAFKGRDAVILADDWHPMDPALRAQFERLSIPTAIPVTHLGVWIKNYYVWKGYNFRGMPSPGDR